MSWHERSLRKARVLTYPEYSPSKLLSTAAFKLGSKTMTELSHTLGFDHGQMSRIWRKIEPVSPALFVAIMDHTGWTLPYVRELAGLPADIDYGTRRTQ